jgi:hypothetical protein
MKAVFPPTWMEWLYRHDLVVNTFNYLGCILSYEGGKDMPSKTLKFVKTIEVTNQVLKTSLVQDKTFTGL